MSLLDEFIISTVKTQNDESCHGVSIYFSEKEKFYDQYIFPGELPCPYKDLTFSYDTSWDEFLKAYLNIQ